MRESPADVATDHQSRTGHRAPPLTTVLAGLCVVLVAMRTEVFLTVTVGTGVALALSPVWLRTLGRYRGARLFVVMGMVCTLVGAWLTAVAAEDRDTSTRLMITTSLILLNIAVGVGVLLWARAHMRDPVVAMLFGAGMVLGVNTDGRFAENPWRFGFSVPLTVLLLAAAWYTGRRTLQVVVALSLALVSALNDGRSSFAMLLLVAVLTMWQASPGTRGRTPSRLRAVMLTTALAVALYQMGQGLILDGYLGESTQQRTASQMAAHGSLLLGARPEAGATLALMELRPQGYGSGTLASTQDLLAAKSGMADLNYDPNNGYVEDYMFGAGIELHSVAADLWVAFGAAGLAWAALIAWQTGRHLAGALALRSASALILYLGVRTFWNLLFSPFYSSVTLLVVAVGLMLPLVPLRPPGREPDVRAYSE